MRKCEKYKAPFLKPRKGRMFSRKEYKLTRRCKILGFTASNGKQLCVTCLEPWNSLVFAKLVRQKVGPFFQAAFPAIAAWIAF